MGAAGAQGRALSPSGLWALLDRPSWHLPVDTETNHGHIEVRSTVEKAVCEEKGHNPMCPGWFYSGTVGLENPGCTGTRPQTLKDLRNRSGPGWCSSVD